MNKNKRTAEHCTLSPYMRQQGQGHNARNSEFLKQYRRNCPFI